MNFEPFQGGNEAKLHYGDGDYEILSPGSFVRCAVTNKIILLEDLKYWDVDRQEAYFDAHVAVERMAGVKAS